MATAHEQESRISIYDEVAFPSYPYPQTHPDRLATIARLCGLQTAAVDDCQVLELGCGAGGNLLPMADSLPRSGFVGIDLSAQQIAIGREYLTVAGLTNVRMEARDILSLDASIGRFDFLIAHGVYSWTTEVVREKILALCRELLAPNGVAYINYNTYPGWHLQGMLRDMLYYHSQSFTDPSERVREARRMIEFLYQTLPAPSTPFGGLVRAELDAIQRNSDAFLFHAYLNVVNQPFYLHEFQRRATAHGLRYLGDAEPEGTWPEYTAPHLAARLKQLTTDESHWSQHFDFIRFGTSRRSLLCHQEVSIERGPCSDALRELHVSAPLRRKEGAQQSTTASFVTTTGRSVSTGEPRLRAALELLADTWPGSIPFEHLALQVEAQVAAVQPSVNPIEPWHHDLVQCFCNHVLELHIRPSRSSKTIAAYPQASALARLQAVRTDFVANRRHDTVRLNEFDRRCLSLLDGSRTSDEISQQLGGEAHQTLARLSASGLLMEG